MFIIRCLDWNPDLLVVSEVIAEVTVPQHWTLVSQLGLHSDYPSSNPADANSFFLKKSMFEKNENKQKEAGIGPFLKKTVPPPLPSIFWVPHLIKSSLTSFFLNLLYVVR